MKYIDKIYGEFELTGIIEELIETRIFQRLNKIHQGGAIFLVNSKMNHTRYEHSIGVMLLIKKLRGTYEEQIAGLIHDISHTAFSHLIDYVLEIEEEDYHEKRYEEVLSNQELNKVFKKYGYDWENFKDIGQYHILEYPLPSLSADRIDYTLRDLFQLGEISKDEIDWFLGGLQIFENRIILKSVDYGEWFQKKYSFLVSEYFGSKENKEINIIMKSIVQECMEKGILEEIDFYYDDFYLINKIETKMNLSEQIKKMKEEGTNLYGLTTKKRMIDPEIEVNNRIMKLSEIN